MRSAVNAFVFWSAAAVLHSALLASAVAADDEAWWQRGSGHPSSDRWIPSLAATSGITIQEWQSEHSSEMCPGCQLPSPSAVALRPSESGDDRDVTPFVGGDLELMTPELPIPLAPRVFAGGGIVATFGFDRKVSREGNPNSVRSPVPEGALDPFYSEDGALGQGSETSVQLDRVMYGARAGLAFPLELFGRSLRLKPSIGWIQYKVEANGLLVDAQCQTINVILRPPTSCSPTPTIPGALREITLEATGSESFNGLGGGLDIEMDTFQIGPLGSSVYIGAHAFKTLGDRKIELGNSESFADTGIPGLGAADTSADFRVEVDEMIYRVGLGLRMHWLGYGD